MFYFEMLLDACQNKSPVFKLRIILFMNSICASKKCQGLFARQLTDLISFGPNSVVFSRRDLINSSFTFSLHLPPALAISLSLPRSFSFSLLFCPLTVSSFFLFFFNSFVSSILCTLHSLSLSVVRLSPVCAQTDIRGSPRHVVLCSSDEMCQG